jgi:hypothetical protein
MSQLLAFIGIIACMFTSSPESIARAFGTTTVPWGPEAGRYQACRSDDITSLPDLVPVQRWSSKKSMSDESITAVTHISLDRYISFYIFFSINLFRLLTTFQIPAKILLYRLSALRSQCASWRDRLAAVVYVPYIQGFGAVSTGVAAVNGSSVALVISVLDMLHQETEHVHKLDGCALDLELIVEEFPKDSWEDPNLWLYPGNALRNRALMLADLTELVLLLDNDQLPAATLPKIYQNRPKTFAAFVDKLIQQRTAIVLPTLTPITSGTTYSFQSVRQVVGQAVSGGKEHAIATWRKLDLGVVDFNGNLNAWANAQKGEFEAVEYQEGEAPALILPRKYVPFYDERFRGTDREGKDKGKALHAAYLTQELGIKLEVHPEAFVVHETPEEQRRQNSGSGGKTADVESNSSWMENVYTASMEEIQLGTYVPVTGFAKWCPRSEKSSNQITSNRKIKF